MFAGKISRLTKVLGIGATGFFAGVASEKYWDYAKVSAARGDGPKGVVLSQGSNSLNIPPGIAQIEELGYPGRDNIRYFSDFVVSYDARNRVPHWVFEHLTPRHVQHNSGVKRSKCQFREDSTIHPFFRATREDYKESGYTKGHLAAAGNHRLSKDHMKETFVLSNIAPQIGNGFNNGMWNSLEEHVRGLTKTYENVYVFSGPLYLPQKDESDGKNYVRYEVIGHNNVAVPTHFFKVVICEEDSGQLNMEAYVMPHEPIPKGTPLTKFQVPFNELDRIERAAGLLFCRELPRNAFRVINK